MGFSVFLLVFPPLADALSGLSVCLLKVTGLVFLFFPWFLAQRSSNYSLPKRKEKRREEKERKKENNLIFSAGFGSLFFFFSKSNCAQLFYSIYFNCLRFFRLRGLSILWLACANKKTLRTHFQSKLAWEMF